MPNQVLVFHQAASCVHCKEYLPRFRKLAEPYRRKVDVRSLNLDRADKATQDAGVKFKIHAVPTTIVLGASERVLRRKEGNLSDVEIAKLLAFAAGE
jgi:thiol-disulfide isomerase/thioredoxin